MLKVWFLCHSGFAVETDSHFLIFDYWKDSPKGGLAEGVIDPRELAAIGKRVVVFASHRHEDHFNPVIFEWKSVLPGLRFVLSDDIAAAPDAQAFKLGPRGSLNEEDFAVRTLGSTDEGVAFLVEADGLRVYHAGDLNWWHWEGEPDPYNEDMGRNYQREIDGLGGVPIDLAFVPVDPRLGKQAVWGLDYLMRHVDIKIAVPMHFWGKARELASILSDPVTDAYRDRILPLTHRGKSETLS